MNECYKGAIIYGSINNTTTTNSYLINSSIIISKKKVVEVAMLIKYILLES